MRSLEHALGRQAWPNLSALPFGPRGRKVILKRALKEQGRQDQRDCREELDQYVERWARSVLEGVAHRVADDRCTVSVRVLSPVSARLDVFFCIVPSAAAVVEEERQQDAGDC